MASAFFGLGAKSVDYFNYKISADELAGALCAAALRPGLHDAASLLLGHADSGTDARAGVRQRLAQGHREAGEEWELMVGLARQELGAVDDAVKAAWRPGVSVAMAFNGGQADRGRKEEEEKARRQARGLGQRPSSQMLSTVSTSEEARKNYTHVMSNEIHKKRVDLQS